MVFNAPVDVLLQLLPIQIGYLQYLDPKPFQIICNVYQSAANKHRYRHNTRCAQITDENVVDDHPLEEREVIVVKW